MFNPAKAKEFADRFHHAWTGNQPEKLAAFYCEDAIYSDPFIREGIQGNKAILSYFKKLLAKNPNWVWTHLEAFPLKDGFLNKWRAKIPMGDQLFECIGVCTIQFDDKGLIRRNEVYFDRSLWMDEGLARRARRLKKENTQT